MKALTIHQPYAWAISRRAVTYAGKGIENRTWTTRHRGALAIHASVRWDSAAEDNPVVAAAWDEYWRTAPWLMLADAPMQRTRPEFVYGAVVAVADLVEVHHSSVCHRGGRLIGEDPYACSPWAVGGESGMYHWVLADVRALREPVPATGRQQLWSLPPEVEASVREQLASLSQSPGTAAMPTHEAVPGSQLHGPAADPSVSSGRSAGPWPTPPGGGRD